MLFIFHYVFWVSLNFLPRQSFLGKRAGTQMVASPGGQQGGTSEDPRDQVSDYLWHFQHILIGAWGYHF